MMKNNRLHRRVRYLHLSVCYVQGLVAGGQVQLPCLPTVECIADCLTKVLGTEAMKCDQANLGILEVEGPTEKQKHEPNTQVAEQVVQKQHPYWSCATRLRLDQNWLDFSDGRTVPPMFPIWDHEMEALKEELNACFSPIIKFVIVDICTTKRSGFSQLNSNPGHY